MRQVKLQLLSGFCANRPPGFFGNWAGFRIESNIELPGLAAAVGSRVAHETDTTVRGEPDIFIRDAFVAGIEQPLALWHQNRDCYIGAVGGYQIGSDPTLGWIRGAETTMAAQILMGPIAPLMMAAHGVYQLHGSAIQLQDGVVIIVGQSGAGKSTLARAFGEHRIADDTIALANENQGPTIPGWLPQQKTPSLMEHGSLPLMSIIELEPDRPFACARLSTSSAALSLIRHTVAGRLFQPHRQRDHLAFAARIAASVPVYRVAHPRRRDTLPSLVARVRTLCAD